MTVVDPKLFENTASCMSTTKVTFDRFGARLQMKTNSKSVFEQDVFQVSVFF